MENEPKSTVESDRTTPRNPIKPSKQTTGMIVVLPVLLLGGALWLGARGPEEKSPVKPVPPVAAKLVAPIPKAATTEKLRPARLEILFPNDDAKLVRKTIDVPDVMLSPERIAANRTQLQETLITRALQRLLKDAADYFPQGSALVAVKMKGGIVDVNLNAAYAANAEGWSSAETTTRVMSIVNTAIATKQQVSGSESDSVRLLINGKGVETMGPLDTSEPIEADNSVVAKA
ncbi:MAG TPA: GerMN domain-containing protein [Abditibacteriaceae bacterium]|jgi:hypothetical protein